MNGFRVCRKFAERARNSIDLRSEINFYSSSLNPPIIEEEEGKKKKEKMEAHANSSFLDELISQNRLGSLKFRYYSTKSLYETNLN